MFGGGIPNAVKNIKYGASIKKWHFIYFGYSWVERKAYAFVKFFDREEGAVYMNVNHYLAEKFFFFVG
jgi:hypothetical protein